MTSRHRIAVLALGMMLALPLLATAQGTATPPTATQQAPAAMPAPAHPYPVPQNMGAMPWMNPMWYPQWFPGFANPWMSQMTHPGAIGPMMGAFDPRWMGGPQGKADGVPPTVPVVTLPGYPTQARVERPKNTVSQGIDLESKRRFYQSMMMMNPMSLHDMFSIMAHKIPVNEDVSFEDAIESMKLRANLVNFKLVGHQAMWKEIEAITGEAQPKIEIFHFCDAMVARQILDYAPEFAVFLPCRIALLEDAAGKIWVMTLDWDVGWLDYAQNPNSALNQKLRTEAKRIRDAIHYIMEGAATGDF